MDSFEEILLKDEYLNAQNDNLQCEGTICVITS